VIGQRGFEGPLRQIELLIVNGQEPAQISRIGDMQAVLKYRTGFMMMTGGELFQALDKLQFIFGDH
jgi:hypothetical protein